MIIDEVAGFMKREDNSTLMPGKRDCPSGKSKGQKRVLSDYLHNLHRKFSLENPDVKLSRSQFATIRPKHIMLANFCNRRHQNLALKLRSLHSQGVRICKNPDTLMCEKNDEEIRTILDTDIQKKRYNLQNGKK